VYLRAAALPELPPLLALVVTSSLPRYAVGAASGRLLARRDRRPAGAADPAALTAGIAVLLRQHQPAHLQANPLTCICACGNRKASCCRLCKAREEHLFGLACLQRTPSVRCHRGDCSLGHGGSLHVRACLTCDGATRRLALGVELRSGARIRLGCLAGVDRIPTKSCAHCTQVLLQHMGQVMRALLSSATDATARGVAAAGVEVGLPEEVRPYGRRNVLFLQHRDHDTHTKPGHCSVGRLDQRPDNQPNPSELAWFVAAAACLLTSCSSGRVPSMQVWHRGHV